MRSHTRIRTFEARRARPVTTLLVWIAILVQQAWVPVHLGLYEHVVVGSGLLGAGHGAHAHGDHGVRAVTSHHAHEQAHGADHHDASARTATTLAHGHRHADHAAAPAATTDRHHVSSLRIDAPTRDEHEPHSVAEHRTDFTTPASAAKATIVADVSRDDAYAVSLRASACLVRPRLETPLPQPPPAARADSPRAPPPC